MVPAGNRLAGQVLSMIPFMWQDDITGVACFIDAYLERVYTSAGPPVGTRHLISPELAGSDVVIILLQCRSAHRAVLPFMMCALILLGCQIVKQTRGMSPATDDGLDACGFGTAFDLGLQFLVKVTDGVVVALHALQVRHDCAQAGYLLGLHLGTRPQLMPTPQAAPAAVAL